MTEEKKSMVPKLRFPEFTETWEQRKFEDLFTEYAEKGFNQYPALSIVQGAGTIERDKSNRNLSYSTKNLGNYKIVYKDDFILHLRSFEGGLERACSTGLVSPAYHVFHSDGVNSSFFIASSVAPISSIDYSSLVCTALGMERVLTFLN